MAQNNYPTKEPMLIPLTPVSELSEEDKRKALATAQNQKIVMVNGKPVSVTELKGSAKPPVRQNLFE